MLRVCVTCRWQGRDMLEEGGERPGQLLYELVKARARPDQAERIHGIVCLTHCMNACNAIAMQRGKVPLLMTRMAPDAAAGCGGGRGAMVAMVRATTITVYGVVVGEL